MMKRLVFVFCLVLGFGTLAAQDDNRVDPDAVVTNPFWDNWYGQVGVDMHLHFPKGYNMSDVFPNGKSFGITTAVGKWFSPEFGGRLKIKWENGILKNEHNTWLRPNGDPGGNQRRGGFITFVGDIQFNVHNLLGEYRPDRKWNLIASPRAGGWINLYDTEGSPILGAGIVNTYRLNDRWRLFADVSYQFVASVNNVSSGTGHGSNGFAEINVGVEMDLSKKNQFHKVSDQTEGNEKSVQLNAFWDNWFVQAGLGMSLINPYETNFADVFPNGKTLGVNGAIGKWFTPDVGLRGGINWQNGIVKNDHAEYLKPREDSEGDPNKTSLVAVYVDVFLNLNHIISGYDESKKWNTMVYPRMGLVRNYQAEYKECPLVGVGVEQTYKINDKIKLFADLAYQVATSGFLDSKFHSDNTGSNGWFDLNVGVQYELGKKTTWQKAK